MNSMTSAFRSVCLAVAAAALAACAAAPLIQTHSLTAATPEQMVAQVRAAAGGEDSELAVQPLRDPMAEDLREDAAKFERAKRYSEAAAALDKALEIAPDDPATLQERAEIALLSGAPEQAETLARRAFEKGAKVGPLCRRHWATVEQTRLVAGDAAGAEAAKAQLADCKVAALERF